MGHKSLVLFVCLALFLNFLMSGFVLFSVKSNPVFSGDYNTEDINLTARIQRANFLGEVLKRQFEIDGGKNLPTIISRLAQNQNPQLWTFGEYRLLKMNSKSFIILTREETEAVIAHELAHIILGHSFKKPGEEPDMREEKEADKFAIRYVSPRALIGAINKLSQSKEEREERISGISE